VLLHELAHVRRHVQFGHTLGRLVCAVYWFHPLVWTAAKRLRAESERACDDLALACGTRAADYAEHLLDIVTSVRGGDATPSVALAMARRKEFEGRMLAILDPDLRRTTPSRRQSTAMISALALLALTVGAASPAPRAPIDDYVAGRTHPDTGRGQRPDTGYRTHPDTGKRPIPDAPPRLDGAPTDGLDRGAQVTIYADAMQTRTHVHERTFTDEVQSLVDSVVTSQVPAIASAAGSIAATTSRATMEALFGHGAVLGRQQQSTDERAALLARVLRSDTSSSLRRIAAWGLREHADATVGAEALANALQHDGDASVREMSAWALAEGDANRGIATDALSSALRGDASERVRSTAAWALGSIGDRSGADALAAALGDASIDVRQRAAWALGHVEPRQAPNALVALLRDKDPHTRKLAAWALFRIADPATAPALDAALKSEQDTDLQMAYIRALAAMGEKSVDALRGLLESSNPEVKSMAVRALAGGHAAGPWPWPWPQPRPRP
jgi:HEAT repeat protein